MTLLTKQEIEALLDGTTPGPWLREAQGVYADNGHKLIASVKSHEHGIAWPTTEANGNIMAAATALARTALDALARLEDAEAAQALVVERAAEIARVHAEQHADMALNGLPENARLREAMEAAFTNMRWAILALASPSGVAALAALRAKIGDLGRQVRDLTRRAVDAESDRDQQLHVALQYEAERDDALTSLAAAEERVAALTEALIWCSGSDDFQVEGKARIGWLKLCAPLLATVTPPADTGEGA